MKRTGLLYAFVLSLAIGLAAASCLNHDLFNKETYRYYIRVNYPVDTLETDHPWTLTRRVSVPVFANVSDNSIGEVRIYNANPQSDTDAEMIARANISPGGSATVTFDVAQTQSTMYAVLVSRSGNYYMQSFSPYMGATTFSDSDAKVVTELPEPKLQTFTYLYESTFPTPDDFDYNDLVMRISRDAPQPNILQLRVTLAAAGSLNKMAGAIRLPGVRYEDVERVEIEEGHPFIDDYPQKLTMLSVDGPLARSRSGEAVICLFEDAHYALTHSVDEQGVLTYQPCNTDPFPDGKASTAADVQTRTYNIYLNIGVSTDSLLLGNLDPFIIEANTQINFEVHGYKYKFSEVMWEYLGDDKQSLDDYMAWSLVIPSGTFRYPVEAVPLGTFHNGELYGAYGRISHSFGEWCRNYRKAYDWWQYPNSALVY